MTLHRHSGKSKSEHVAAGALLDLSLEPVVNTAQPDDEGSHEFEEGSDEFPDPEPIETHINRNTQTDEKLLTKENPACKLVIH